MNPPQSPTPSLNPHVLPTSLLTALCPKGLQYFRMVWFSFKSRGRQTTHILPFPHVMAFQQFAMNPFRESKLAPQQHSPAPTPPLPAAGFYPSANQSAFRTEICYLWSCYIFTEANYRSQRNLYISKMSDWSDLLHWQMLSKRNWFPVKQPPEPWKHSDSSKFIISQ